MNEEVDLRSLFGFTPIWEKYKEQAALVDQLLEAKGIMPEIDAILQREKEKLEGIFGKLLFLTKEALAMQTALVYIEKLHEKEGVETAFVYPLEKGIFYLI